MTIHATNKRYSSKEDISTHYVSTKHLNDAIAHVREYMEKARQEINRIDDEAILQIRRNLLTAAADFQPTRLVRQGVNARESQVVPIAPVVRQIGIPSRLISPAFLENSLPQYYFLIKCFKKAG